MCGWLLKMFKKSERITDVEEENSPAIRVLHTCPPYMWNLWSHGLLQMLTSAWTTAIAKLHKKTDLAGRTNEIVVDRETLQRSLNGLQRNKNPPWQECTSHRYQCFVLTPPPPQTPEVSIPHINKSPQNESKEQRS